MASVDRGSRRDMFETRWGPCDVCVWAYGRSRPTTTSYCGKCGAWICADCWYKWSARAWAAFMRWKASPAERERMSHA